MSWRDSTIIAPVSVDHRVSYAERYSRFIQPPYDPHWRCTPSTECSSEIVGRGYKAMSGNCWLRRNSPYAAITPWTRALWLYDTNFTIVFHTLAIPYPSNVPTYQELVGVC